MAQPRSPKAKFSAGPIQVAVWENEGKEGKSYTTVSLDKRYKVGEEWKSTNSMKVNELPKAILALQKAYEYLCVKESGTGQATRREAVVCDGEMEVSA